MGRKSSGGLQAWRTHVQTVLDSSPSSSSSDRAEALEEALKQAPLLFCRIANKPPPALQEEGQHETLVYPPYTYISTQQYTQNENDYFLDPASIFPVAALDVNPTHAVLDMCAAPGGKSLLLASQLFCGKTEIGQVQLVCNELSAARLARLQRTIKSHYPNDYGKIQIVSSDPTKSLTVTGRYGPYDRILIDAPCSSDQHKLVNNNLHDWRIAVPKRFAEVQMKLLMGGFEMLKVGGRLVYSTCALSNIENVQVICKALSKSTKCRAESHETVEELLRMKIVQSNRLRMASTSEEVENQSQPGATIRLERLPIGHIILPDKSTNAGPIYFAVVTKQSR